MHTRGQGELLSRLFQTLTKWILGFTLPLATVVIVFARPIMRIFGPEFEAGWIVLVIGTLGQLVNCATGSVGYLLLMSGNQGRLIQVQTIMTAILIALNLVMVPRWGILGAAIAAALCNMVSNTWYLTEVRGALGALSYNRSYARLLLPALVAVLAVVAMHDMHIDMPAWLWICASAGICYATFFGTCLILGFDGDDRLVAQAVWSRIRGSLGSPLGEG